VCVYIWVCDVEFMFDVKFMCDVKFICDVEFMGVCVYGFVHEQAGTNSAINSNLIESTP